MTDPEIPQLSNPHNLYGEQAHIIDALHAARPLDLHAANCMDRPFDEWKEEVQAFTRDGLHYDAGSVDLEPETVRTWTNDGLHCEEVRFNTSSWNRAKGYFLKPQNATGKIPGLVVFHAWGGPMIFGASRIVDTGRDHPLLKQHREKAYSGKYLAHEMARAGYGVIVIDAFHFGERVPYGLGHIPKAFDAFDLDINQAVEMNQHCVSQLYLGVRNLNWAGTTWAGINFGDDAACIDYLQSRDDIDSERVGCTGLSGGGWRTNMLSALDNRIKASVSVGWMTTGREHAQFNVNGAVGTFNLLPGVWRRIDIPDLAIMAAPRAALVVCGTYDQLFPIESKEKAAQIIADGFKWAGVPDKGEMWMPPKVHCFDDDTQAKAIDWFAKHL